MGVHHRVVPAHHLDRPVVLAHIAADDLDAVAPQIDDRASAGLFGIEEPGAVGTGVRLPRACHQHVPDGAVLHGLDRLQGLGGVDQVLKVPVEDAGILDHLQNLRRFGSAAGQRLGAENRLDVRGLHRLLHHLQVHEVRQADHDRGDPGVVEGFVDVGCPGRYAPFFGGLPGPVLRAGLHDGDPVPVALAVQRLCVEHADQAGPQHGNVLHGSFLRFGCANGLDSAGVLASPRRFNFTVRPRQRPAPGTAGRAPAGPATA